MFHRLLVLRRLLGRSLPAQRLPKSDRRARFRHRSVAGLSDPVQRQNSHTSTEHQRRRWQRQSFCEVEYSYSDSN
jgi:hypothetical protein